MKMYTSSAPSRLFEDAETLYPLTHQYARALPERCQSPTTFCQSCVFMAELLLDTSASEEESMLIQSQLKMGCKTSADASWSSGRRVRPRRFGICIEGSVIVSIIY